MNSFTIWPGPLRGAIAAPPSKSYTHRELVVSFLANAPSVLRDPLLAEDTRTTVRGLVTLGAKIHRQPGQWHVEPPRRGRGNPPRRRSIECGQSGTSLRFLTALAATRDFPVTLRGSAQLARRPIEPLLAFLEEAGATVQWPRSGRSVPVTVRGPIHALRGTIRASESSQYLSAALLVLPTTPGTSRIQVPGRRVSNPYVSATLDVLARRGVVWRTLRNGYESTGPAEYAPARVAIPGDASSASFLWAGAALTNGSVRVRRIPTDRPQADLRILALLEAMGATVHRRHDDIEVRGGPLRGISVDLSDAPDLLPIVGVLAAHASGGSRIRGAAHAALKESDRRAGLAALVRVLGGSVRASGKMLVVRPGARHPPFVWNGPEDHRLVMSAAVAALGAEGPSRVENGGAVKKSFPDFWRSLRALGARAEATRR